MKNLFLIFCLLTTTQSLIANTFRVNGDRITTQSSQSYRVTAYRYNSYSGDVERITIKVTVCENWMSGEEIFVTSRLVRSAVGSYWEDFYSATKARRVSRGGGGDGGSTYIPVFPGSSENSQNSFESQFDYYANVPGFGTVYFNL